MRTDIEQQLAQTDLTREVQQNLLLVFAEITTNLVEHSKPCAKNIDITLQQKGEDLWQLEICDDGGSFGEFSRRIDNLEDTLNIDNLDNGGMGLYLLNKCFPNHHYISGVHSPSNLLIDSASPLPSNKPSL